MKERTKEILQSATRILLAACGLDIFAATVVLVADVNQNSLMFSLRLVAMALGLAFLSFICYAISEE